MGAARDAGLTSGVVIDGRYEIVRPLGAGGMGEVYAALRRSLGDEVAIKRLLPAQDTPTNRQRFATEAQAAAHIRHPNVIQVFDYGDDPEVGPFLVMEKLDGPTLAEELGDGGLPLGRALWVFAAVCAAIEAGHRRGIVHRDLKPANVMIAPTDDGRQVVKVLDFGLALDLRLPGRDITAPGAVIGTIAYMAPEQTEGMPASTRSDVFALGVLLYEMVTGQLPFDGATSLDTLMAINGGRYRPPQELVPDLPACVIEAIDAALVRDPGGRPDSPERLAQLASAGLTIVPPAARPFAPTRSRPMAVVRASPEHTLTRDTEATMPVYGRFTGRTAELRRLDEAFTQTLAGRPPMVLLTGDAGLGKSRLAERFAAEARERGALALVGRFFDYAGSRPPPLETFVAMLSAAGAAGEETAARVQSSLDTAGDDARWNAFAAIADGLAGQAAGRPLILTLDDLQWASRADLDLIDHLHRSLGPRATLIVATARPVDGGELMAWRARRTSAIVELPLAPFDEAELREWLEAVFKNIRLGSLETRRLLRTTGGNPFALVEITRHLAARGELVRDEAGWRLKGLSSVELPDSVAAVVRVRLGELPAPQRAVLEAAAVLGDEFRVATLAAACGASEEILDDALDRAFALRLVSDRDVVAGNDYRFTTTLIRQVLYDELPARARRRLHREVARALATIYGTADDRFAHVFGYHHYAVGAWAESFELNVRAAQEAVNRGDLDLAQQVIARADASAAGMASASPVGEAPRLLLARLDYLAGCVATQLGELDVAATRLARAISAAEAEGAHDVAIDARIELVRATAARGQLTAAYAEAALAAEAATAADDPGRALAARVMGAEVQNRAGLADPRVLDELVAACASAPPAVRARAFLVRAWQRLKAGEFAASEADAIAAGDLARGAGRQELQLRALATQAAVRSEAGDVAGSMALSQEVLVMARRIGDRRREGICLANLGEGWVDLGEARRGHECFSGALQIFVDIGDRACEGDCRVNIGRALLALGRVEEAVAMLERAAEMCASTSRVEYEGIAFMLLGEAREGQGDALAARDAFARAVALFQRIDLNLRWRAELGLARTLTALDDRRGAREAATRAHNQLAQQRASLARGTDPAALEAAMAEAAELRVGRDPTDPA